MVERPLGGRYEVMDRIGGGGMAIVYKGHDLLLNRKVAIKVLRQQFVHDEDFIKRFRREAQAAASLSHPNVVSIYDVGQEEDVHYIVMEYVEGTNLNVKIKQAAPLQVEEALHIAAQICDALEHAHQNQIIHRDIKPHNILLGRNGRVKVTDFGIARAAASNDLTQTGSVLGSVHYFSPEHAKGIAQGAKSDLYSLGIVLYQMLTNTLPFLGESPISVALKHLQEEFEEPRKLNPLIPQSVENIILKALRKDPEERYGTATEMLRDLETAMLPERINEPKLRFDELHDEDKTIIMPAIRDDGSSSPASGNVKENDRWEGVEESPSRGKPWLKPSIWLAVTIILVLGMWTGVNAVIDAIKVPEVTVPDVRNMPLEEAVAQLEEQQLKADPILEEHSDEYDAGIVMEQDNVDMKVKVDSSVRLVVSLGADLETMDDYVGEEWTDVALALNRYGLREDQIVVTREYSEEPSGTVIRQSPEGNETFDPKTAVLTFTVSQGLGTVSIPNLINYKQSVAEAMLTQLDMEVKVELTSDYKVQQGYVIDQFPYKGGDQAEPGSTITLWVSSGYPEDALAPVVNIDVVPENQDEPTTVQILYSDARGDNQEWGVRDITEPTTFPVRVIVSPQKSAIVTYLVNGNFEDTFTITYKDAQDQGAPRPDSSMMSTPPQPQSSGQSGEAGAETEGDPEDGETDASADGQDMEPSLLDLLTETEGTD